MMRRILGWALMALMTALAGCGGGGSTSADGGTCMLCGTAGSDSSGTSAVADLRLTLSAQTIANKAPELVTLTVNAVNSSNQVVSGADVVVTADTGIVTATASSTDDAGNLTATVGMGSNATARTITVRATSGSLVKTATITVVDSLAGGTASLGLTLSHTTVTASDPAVVSIVLKDSSGAVVPSAVVKFSTTGGLGKLSSNSALTDSAGTASVVLSPVDIATSGADYVVASATVNGDAVSNQAGFSITATNVSVTSFTSDLGNARLAAYGQANLTVKLGGTVVGTPVALSISSLCLNKGKATITPTTYTTSNGTATFTYKDVQCGATDTSDTITVSVVGASVTSTLSLPLTSPIGNSITFESASPSTIYLKGSGFTETSTITFAVRDQAGNPLPNQSVNLTPVNLTGGLTMEGGAVPVVRVSDSNGKVTARINAGSVPTPVRVRANLVADDTVTTVSSGLSIAVGLPSQLNFSLSQTTINIEGMDIDGVANTYRVVASDRLGNPVPTDTSINFIAEGGQIQSSSSVVNSGGLASATAAFQSAEPRPADGRITIVAYALGEESFLDANANNLFDGGSPAEDYQDLGDVFLSRSFSSTFFPAVDQVIKPGYGWASACAAHSSVLLDLDVSIPSVPSTCNAAWGRTFVRRATETVLSKSTSNLLWFRSGAGELRGMPAGMKIDSGCVTQTIVTANDGVTSSSDTYFLVGAGGLYSAPGTGTLRLQVADSNPVRLNPMPAGTTITAVATEGMSVSVGGTPVANTSGATTASLTYKFLTASSGTITVTTTSPKGTATTFGFDIAMSASPATGLACTQ